jgi:6,7-dimethyl-8-ribityllumazine synthase
MSGTIDKLGVELQARGHSYALVVARWNAAITEPLLEGAIRALKAQGAEDNDIKIHRCSGAFELVGAVARAAQRTGVDGVIAIGCLIKGDTDHYEYIAGPVSQALALLSAELAVRTNPVALAFGLLTVRTQAQAEERARPGPENKGAEVALACIEQVNLLRAIAL